MASCYSVNFTAFDGVFAVPNCLVDQHIKLAGAVQLKVLLWVLRQGGQPFTPEDIAAGLNLSTGDVCDAMQYWVSAGLIFLPKEENASAEAALPDAAEFFEEAPSEPVAPPPAKPNIAPRRQVKPTGVILSERIKAVPGRGVLNAGGTANFGTNHFSGTEQHPVGCPRRLRLAGRGSHHAVDVCEKRGQGQHPIHRRCCQGMGGRRNLHPRFGGKEAPSADGSGQGLAATGNGLGHRPPLAQQPRGTIHAALAVRLEIFPRHGAGGLRTLRQRYGTNAAWIYQ